MGLFVKNDHYSHVEVYEDELMERLMSNYELYPPMKVWRDSLKYILATVNGKIFPWCRVSEKQVDMVYDKMKAYIMETVMDTIERRRFLKGLDTMWPKLQRKMQKNRGLWKMMCDSGAESLSFARFPVSLVPRAIALESAFGTNYDNAGIYRDLIRISDLSMRSAVAEPEFVELRRRAYNARGCILDHIPELERYEITPSPEKLGTVVTMGAGLLIELRKFGMTLAQLQSLNIVACDMDKTLLDELDVVFRHDFGVPFAESGIDYRICKVETLLKDDTLWRKVNVVLMDGILSYCKNEEQMMDYLAGANRLRNVKNGVIFCDLTVLDISLMRCAIVQGWTSEDKDFAMHPEMSAKQAVKKMRRICDHLELEMNYEIDSRNPSPLGVIFWINDTLAW